MDSADLAVFKPDLYSAGMEGCAGEDILDYSFSETSGPLVFFQDDRDRQAGVNVFSVLAVHAKGFSMVSGSARVRSRRMIQEMGGDVIRLLLKIGR